MSVEERSVDMPAPLRPLTLNEDDKTTARAILHTHFVRWDDPGGRMKRALCGRLVDEQRDHRNKPSCPTCQRLLGELEKLSP